GKDYPKVRDLQIELDAWIAKKKEMYKATAQDGGGKALDPVKAYMLRLRRDLEFGQMYDARLDAVLKDERKDEKEQGKLETEEAALRQEIENTRILYDGSVKKLNEMSLVAGQGGFRPVVIAPPGNGGQVGPHWVRITGIGAILGMLAGCGLAYLAYLSDQSFRTPEEIRRRLGLPLIGHIPSFVQRGEATAADAEGPPLDRSLLTFYRSKSREAEAYRGVRTALFFSTRGEGHKVIQVTSPDMGDGKTTLAANLAISIAQSEKRIILVDADLRRPRIDKLFGLSNDRGLTSLLTGEADLRDVVQESGVPGLHILTTGETPDNPAELLSLPRFKQLLNNLRNQSDFVVVD